MLYTNLCIILHKQNRCGREQGQEKNSFIVLVFLSHTPNKAQKEKLSILLAINISEP